jgi:hypothetical protein
MSDRAVVSGAIFRPPAQKMTKAGRPFAFLTIRSGMGETVKWWRVFAFSEAVVEEIMQLGDGEPIAVSGEFDAEIYAPDDAAPRISWKITADAIISAKRPRPQRAAQGRRADCIGKEPWRTASTTSGGAR